MLLLVLSADYFRQHSVLWRALTDLPENQWLITSCAGICLLAGTKRLLAAHQITLTAIPYSESLRSVALHEFSLAVFLFLAFTAYALCYSVACSPPDFLVLLAGVALGRLVAATRFGHMDLSRFGSDNLLTALVWFLALASVFHPQMVLEFSYRQTSRWTGPYSDPNSFGLLMGVGVVLSLALIGRQLVSGSSGILSLGNLIKHPRQAEGGILQVLPRLKTACLGAVAVLLMAGLVNSYSREAWLGTVVALAYLVFQAARNKPSMASRSQVSCADNLARLPKSSELPPSARSERFLLPVAIIAASFAVFAFWSFRHAESAPVRRVFSVANASDFSWRNRIVTYVGSLQMMADRPWFGLGWNELGRVYDKLYRPSELAEDAHISVQSNAYFILAMTLGIPVTVCFLMYVGGCLIQRSGLEIAHTARYGANHLPIETVCRAGAIVLLVGFWFDGGLFRLPTGATFWSLLELGRDYGGRVGISLSRCMNSTMERPD